MRSEFVLLDERQVTGRVVKHDGPQPFVEVDARVRFGLRLGDAKVIVVEEIRERSSPLLSEVPTLPARSLGGHHVDRSDVRDPFHRPFHRHHCSSVPGPDGTALGAYAKASYTP